MTKKIFIILALFFAIRSAYASDSLQYRRMDSVMRHGSVACGVSADYFRSLAKPLTYPGDPTAVIVPSSFPAFAIDTCGKFRIFYADRAAFSGHGFDEGSGIGPNRRAVMCAAITYIQSVIDFGAIPVGQYIRLYVDTSYTSAHPAPWGTSYFGQAGPRIAPGASGLVSGFVHDFIVSGSDPAPLDYHAEMKINFDRVFVENPDDDTGYVPSPFTYHEALSGMSSCNVHLLSTFVHELTHTLGWVSYLSIFPSSTVSTLYSPIDTAVHSTSVGTSLTTLSKAMSGGFTTASPSDHNFWLNGKQAPDNYPVYTHTMLFTGYKWATSFAHLDDVISSYTKRQRTSPGDNMDYVMGAFGIKGTVRSQYTKAEMVSLDELFGYTLTGAYSSGITRTNRLPWSSRMSSVDYDLVFDSYAQNAWPERIMADAVLVNDSGSSWVINLAADTSLHDADGDPISVYPGTMVNFRGGGNGGNNHAQVSVSPDGKTITYTPRHNFYGRCQFGYNIWDNKEKGAFVLQTLDVLPGTNVNSKAGENIVINGDFEEGTEVKIKGVSETINNSAVSLQFQREGRLSGQHFSDGHPYDFFANGWVPYGSGAMIKNAAAPCDSSSLYYSFGAPGNNAFPSGAFPLQPGDSGNRYQRIRESLAGYYYLSSRMQGCKQYKLSFDTYVSGGTLLPLKPKPSLAIGFLSGDYFSFDDITVDDYRDPKLLTRLKPDVPMGFGPSWQHYDITFSYCSDTDANMLFIRNLNGTNNFLIDNISIVEDTLPASIAIHDSVLVPCSNIRLYAQIKNAPVYNCSDTVLKPLDVVWTVDGTVISTDTIIYVTPKATTTYIVTTGDGCHSYADTITLAPVAGPELLVKDTAICLGDSVSLSLAVSGTTGAVSYLWEPATGLSCTSCANPKASPATTTTYTVTVTDDLGCAKAALTATVRSLPLLDATDAVICKGRIATLRVEGDEDNRYKWYSLAVCDTCMTTASTTGLEAETRFPVTVTDLFGCMNYDTAVISIFADPPVIISPKPAEICHGDTLKLKVAGGFSPHRWEGPLSTMSCALCDSIYVYPPVTMIYKAYGISINGCETHDSVMVTVLPKPDVSASVSDTAICGAGYVTLSAGGASSYSWSPTTGVTSPLSATTTAYAFTSTKYIVTGTNTFGCRNKDSVSVTVRSLPTIGVVASPAAICDGDSATLTASGAISYSWSPSTGLSSTTGNPVKAVAPSSSITYTVTGTDAFGCTNTATKTISKTGCACSPIAVFGSTATTLSGTSVTGAFSSGNYYIPANITITGATSFTGAKILIEQGVLVTVAATAKLTLDSCHLFTCPDSFKMWQGIVLASSGSNSGRIEVRNNSMIEDAFYAINANLVKAPPSGDLIKSTNSIYNRNWISINISNGYSLGGPGTYPVTLTGNIFTARDFNKTNVSGYPLKWPGESALRNTTTVTDATPSYVISKDYPRAYCKDGQMSYLGVQLDNIGATYGTSYSEVLIGGAFSVSQANLFDNHRYGLHSYNSNTSVRNNIFINIGKRISPSSAAASVSLPDYGGIGAVAQSTPASPNNRFQVVPAVGNAGNVFHDCFFGIYTDGIGDLEASNCIVKSSHRIGSPAIGAAYPTEIEAGIGIISSNRNYLKYNVSSNYIANMNIGIYAAFGSPRTGATAVITGNRFKGADTGIAVGLTGKQYIKHAIRTEALTYSGPTVTLDINENKMAKVFNGIQAYNFQNIRVGIKGNIISLWDTVTSLSSLQNGITHWWNYGTSTAENIISTPSLSAANIADRITGVYTAFGVDNKVCGNTTTNIGRGFEFAMKTPQTGTRWIGNTMNNGYRGFLLGSDIGDQGFMYNWLTISPRTFYGATRNKWIGFTGGSKVQTIAMDYTNTLLSKLYVKDIPSGTAERPIFNTSSPLALYPNLYDYLPSPPRSIIVATAQWDANCDGAIYPQVSNPPRPGFGGGGIITLGRKIMADSLGYDSSFYANQWMAQLSLYQLGINEPSLRDSVGLFDTFMTVTANSRYAWIMKVQAALDTTDTLAVQNLLANYPSAAGRVQVNNSLVITDYSAANYMVANYRVYFDTYLRYLKGTMTGTDSSNVGALTLKCPARDGAVVYQARTFYNLLTRSFRDYNDDGCRATGYSNLYRVISEQEPLSDEIAQSYRLFPNPNEGRFSIRQQFESDDPVDVKLYNATGMLIGKEKQQFINGTLNFRMANPVPGLYLVCLTDKNQKTTCLKFNIE